VVRGAVGLREASYPTPAERHALFERLARDVGALPGVASAAVAGLTPFTGSTAVRPVEGEGANELGQVVVNTVGEGYFATLAIPLSRGRDFTRDDAYGGEPVAIVSESVAATLWPGQDPLGRALRLHPFVMLGAPPGEPGAFHRVVGVAGDVQREVGGIPAGDLYLTYRQASPLWMAVVARTAPGAPPVVSAIDAVVRDLDPEVPFYGVAHLEDAVAGAAAPTRFLASVFGGFAAFAFLLAILGLYGVIAYAARQRRRDVAIRMALGADRDSVVALFLVSGLSVAVVGVVLGSAGGVLLGRALRTQLHGVEPGDWPTQVGLGAALLVTATLASWLPARGAARADPMGALREE
jgi:predicted permease